MTLSIKNGGYAFLIKLDLMFSMSLWKDFQLLQVLNDLSIRHLIQLILYETEKSCKRSPVQVDLWYVWSVRFWLLIPEMNTSRKSIEWLICFSIVNLMLGCLLFKSFKKFNESCSLSTAARRSSTFRFLKIIIFIKPHIFVKTHTDVSKGRSLRRTHGYSIDLIIKLTVKNKMSLWCKKEEKFFKFFSSDV